MEANKENELKEPLVSIIVPAYNLGTNLYNCLESIRKFTTYPNYELIVVHSHGSFAQNCNRGIRMATGKYICLFNDDAIASWKWLEPLVEILEVTEQNAKDGEKIAGVSPRMLFPDGRCQFGGMIFHGDENRKYEAGHYGWGWASNDERLNQVRIHQATTFGCVLIRNRLFGMIDVFGVIETTDEIGLLDENYVAGGFEDIDWCLRAALKGWKFVYMPASNIIHAESQTFNNMNRKQHYESFIANRKRYHEKWDRFWQEGKFEIDDVKYPGGTQ